MTHEIKQRIEQIKRGEVPQGYKWTKVGIVPREWDISRIKEVSSLSSGTTPSRGDAYNFSGDVLWVSSGELKNKYLSCTNEKITENAVRKNNLKTYETGTLIIAIYGLEAAGVRGTASLVVNKCCISQACMAFTDYKNVISEYLYYWYIFNGQIIGLRYAQGTKQQNLSTDIINNIQVALPLLTEQEKIAEILTTQDKVIELKEKLLAEKQAQKKWLMQNLLTGKKRLSGFSGEWKKVMLGELCNITTGKLDANAMNENGKYPFFTCAKEAYKIDNYAFDSEAILISGNGANVGYVHYYKGKFNAYQRTYILDNIIENIFWLKHILDKDLSTRIDKEKNDGNTPYIIMSTLTQMKLHLPPLPEQTAIAEILTTADKEIELLQKQLTEEKKKKKALMQLLLTGIVRV